MSVLDTVCSCIKMEGVEDLKAVEVHRWLNSTSQSDDPNPSSPNTYMYMYLGSIETISESPGTQEVEESSINNTE